MTGVKFLKKLCFNVHDHIKSAHTAINLHRVLCMSLKKRSAGAYIDLAQHCIRKGVYLLKYLCDQCAQ